uniref:Uncharacterized protein n=1 Tax=Glossina austeni TaxID=7395 RepID=A0A1A9VCC4_GLOAU
MLIGVMKVLLSLILSLMFTVSLVNLVILIWSEYPTLFGSDASLTTVNQWLEENNLTDYKQLFKDKEKIRRDMLERRKPQNGKSVDPNTCFGDYHILARMVDTTVLQLVSLTSIEPNKGDRTCLATNITFISLLSRLQKAQDLSELRYLSQNVHV